MQVVDLDNGKGPPHGKGLGEGGPDQEGAQEPGARGDGDGLQVRRSAGGPPDGGADHRDQILKVLAPGQLRDDPTVRAMNLDLRSNDRGQDPRAVFDHGSGRLVTRGLDAQDQGHVRLQENR